jgi:dTDP-4-amino-4,6-dideoxygalactose transaminase
MVAYSLYVAHIITSIEGGIVVTDREDFAEVLRSLRSHGRACKCKQCVINSSDQGCRRRFQYGGDVRFVFERIGFSCKMNELEAAVGLGSMERYEEILRKRHDNLLALMAGLERFAPVLRTIREEAHERIGPHALPVLVDAGAPFTRDEIVRHLEQSGIDTRSLFASMPTQCAGFAFLGHRLGQFPQAEYAGDHGFHVGVHQDLSGGHIEHVLETLDEFITAKCGARR